MRTYVWQRANENVKFRGFSQQDIARIQPALISTDVALNPNRKLNTTFVKKQPSRMFGQHMAALTTYHIFPFRQGRSTVKVNPAIFERGKRNSVNDWNPPGVISHEIGHIIGPARPGINTNKEIRDFQKTFGYKQRNIRHTYAVQVWKQRRNNPLRGAKTRQSHDAAEDFAETWRALTGQPLVNKTSRYFDVTITPQRENYMQRYYLK